jgi:Flp pilus assembly pilin Flp
MISGAAWPAAGPAYGHVHPRVPKMSELVQRLWAEESGQDLIEYALLASFLGFACVTVFDQLRTAIGNTYQSWNTGNNNLWSPPNPGP